MNDNINLDNQIFGTGFIPSELDERDYGIDKIGIKYNNAEDKNYFLVKYIPNVYDQKNIGQCVAFSLAKIKEAQELKERGVRIRFSNSFIYANRDDRDYQGEGMYPRQALKRLSKYGTSKYDYFDKLDTYPNVKNDFDNRINELLPLGLSQRINTYVRLKNNEEIMAFLESENVPALYCIELFENFNTIRGVIPMPKGKSLGGHAMIVCGWMTLGGKKHWIVSNSWSENWGVNGYCYIPFDYPLMEVWGTTDRNPQDEFNKKQRISFVANTPLMITDTKAVMMDVNTIIQNGRTLVPVRFIAEALNLDIEYERLPDGREIITLTNGGEVKKL